MIRLSHPETLSCKIYIAAFSDATHMEKNGKNIYVRYKIYFFQKLYI